MFHIGGAEGDTIGLILSWMSTGPTMSLFLRKITRALTKKMRRGRRRIKHK